jgi:hemerythrin
MPMKLIDWNTKFETGIIEVDQQHKFLVELINHFGLLVSQQKVDHKHLEQVFSELLDYTRYHFQEEEKIIYDAGIDSRHVETHVKEHRGFVDEIKRLYGDKGLLEVAGNNLFEFLVSWLIFHILDSDARMSKQLRLLEAGSSPAEAFSCCQKDPDNIKELLLDSLLSLFNQVSLRNRELKENNLALEKRVEERTRELTSANKQLGTLAMTDPLTDLPNRRKALLTLKKLWVEAKQQEKPLSCIMIDADKFKQINDNYGHDAGDRVLIELATELAHSVRTDDLVSRLGGDEFLILCPDTDLKGALQLAQQIHSCVAMMEVMVPGGSWSGSISLGVAVKDQQDQHPEDLIKRADNGVILAKNNGKNRIEIGLRS